MRNIYLVKKLTEWMLEEISVMSLSANFTLVILREVDPVFSIRLKNLVSNGITIKIFPKSTKHLLRKIFILIPFIFKHLTKLPPNYNAVFAIKSYWWFLQLDIDSIGSNANVHAQFATQASLIALLLKKYYNNSEFKYSFTFHAYDIYFHNKWFKLLSENADNCFSISEFNINYVEQKYSVHSNLKLSRLGAFPTEKNGKVRSTTQPFVIGMLSYLVEKKGTIYLLESVLQLKMKCVDIKVIIAGEGPYKKALQEFVFMNNISDSVTFIGMVFDKTKETFFREIDLFVLPCIQLKHDMDGIPVVLMEAINYGIPIISTNISGVPEICINNYNGLLIDERSPKAIANAIEYVMRNPADFHKFQINALLHSENYNIIKNTNQKIQYLDWK